MSPLEEPQVYMSDSDMDVTCTCQTSAYLSATYRGVGMMSLASAV